MTVVDILKQLSDIPGPSGREESVRGAVVSLIDGYCECRTDPLGNLLVSKKGKERANHNIQLSAHMDEVGFIITQIEENGLLRFETVGGIDSRVILGKAVEIGENRIYGVIGSKAVHHQKEEERATPLSVDRLYIDIGAKNRTEALNHTAPGEFAVYHTAWVAIGEHKIMGRAFDDRVGCALLVDLIRSELPYDCSFSFTVQEETGCIGAMTAAYHLGPDICIAVEATTASDIPGTPPEKRICEQGKGPVISFMDKGTVYDQGLYRLTLETAAENGIPCQSKLGVYGANESRSMQTAKTGARTIAVSLPCRYIHSPSNVLDLRDIAPTRELLGAMIERLAVL